MLTLREHAATVGTTVTDLQERVTRIEGLLDEAQGHRGDGNTAMLGALTITLREGLEAVLLAGALLMLVRRRGAPELVRYVHAGWIAAVILGGVTWLVAGELLSGMQRELAEGIAALLAATVLLGVTHWLLGQLTAQRFMGMLATRLEQIAGGKRAALGVFGLSFIAVYREAFEVVLFFQALLLDAGEARSRVWLGTGIGLVLLVVTALVLRSVGQRLKPRPLMVASSGLLALLAFTLSGKGIRAFQEAGVLPITSLPLPELPALGIFATAQGALVQGLLLVLLIASAAAPMIVARRNAGAAAE
jgi:high-affinity iron transporter